MIVTWLFRLVVIPLSYLPLWVLDAVAGFIGFFVFQVFGYRKEVIIKNLSNSFPQKSQEEIKAIAGRFTTHLGRILFTDSLKMFYWRTADVPKLLTLRNPEVLQELHQEGRSVILVGGHYGNWEYHTFLPAAKGNPYSTKGIYKVQKNKTVDKILKENRSKFGLELIPMDQVKRFFVERRNEQYLIIFLGDQSPLNPRSAWWTRFLNQETGVLFGAEKMAGAFGHAVVYCELQHQGNHHYEMVFTLITKDPKAEAPGFITEQHTRLLEKSIMAEPPYWLWSHKRWKHKKPEGV